MSRMLPLEGPHPSLAAVQLFLLLLLAVLANARTDGLGAKQACLPSEAAHNALADAWDIAGNYTVPCGSHKNCPGVISIFTSSFTAAANARINATRGVLEFNTMMDAQWSNGFLPHAYFPGGSQETKQDGDGVNGGNEGTDHSDLDMNPTQAWHGLTPGGRWWNKKPRQNMNGDQILTSGIASPPIQATAALQIYLYLYHAEPSGTIAHDFLLNAYKRLHAWHAYLHNFRDVDANGLVYIRHPWESPLAWNSSSVSSALSRVNISAIEPSLLPVNSTWYPDSVRQLPGYPGDAVYNTMLSVAECQKSLQWNEHEIANTNISRGDLGSPCGFLVEDVSFNALLLRADVDLHQIGVYLLQDKQELEYDGDIQIKQLEIQGWIRLLKGETALGSTSLVRGLPETDVAGGAVMISHDIGHPNSSGHDAFDLGGIFPLLAADYLPESVVDSLSATALSPLFWTRYPLSESVTGISPGWKGEACKVEVKDHPLSNEEESTGVTSSAVSMHVIGMLVQAWSIDVKGDARSTLSVLANFMSAQARILFPKCPKSDAQPFFDHYGSNTGQPLASVAEFGSIVSSPRAAAISVILDNLTLPSAPPNPPVGLGLTIAIMWVELGFAFTVGTSCIGLALYHIRLLAKEDEEDSNSSSASRYHNIENDMASPHTPYRGGDSDLLYGTGEDSDGQTSNSERADDVDGDRRRSIISSSQNINPDHHNRQAVEWSWPLSMIFGVQATSTSGRLSPVPNVNSSSRGGRASNGSRDPKHRGRNYKAPSTPGQERVSDGEVMEGGNSESDSDEGYYRSTNFRGV